MSNKFLKIFFSSLTVRREWDDVAASRPFNELESTPKDVFKRTLEKLKERGTRSWRYLVVLIEQIVLASLIGLVAGVVGAAFQWSMRYAAAFFLAKGAAGVETGSLRPIFLLPVAGVAIVFLYRLARLSVDAGTNQIVDSLTGEKKASLWLAPLIFVGSTITQFFGGSAGREGAALQLGGCVGLGTGRILKLKDSTLHIAILCGMSGAFAAVFGAPLTAAVFALEIACVGVVYYPAFLPALISATIGSACSSYCGLNGFRYAFPAFEANVLSLAPQAVALGLACGVVCIFFCSTIRIVGRSFARRFPNDYLRVVFGGSCIAAATAILGTNAFNGTGLTNIQTALEGNAGWADFILKTLFTAVSLGAGFKGGEIVPALAVGATFGSVAGQALGLSPEQGAGLGMIAVFCGATNCPLTALILSVEFFGAQNALVFAIVCGVCYMTSGSAGLYRSQTVLFSKLTANPFDEGVKKVMENDPVMMKKAKENTYNKK